MEQKIEQLLSQLTLEEKLDMIHGAGLFRTEGVERLGIPSFYFSDGPHGVRAEFQNSKWIAAGNDDETEIIKSISDGLYAKKMGGGSVNPATGEFNFAVNVGYMIEDGKITKPVKGATLVGSGKDILLNVDMIANNLECSQGMCGSMSGSVPTNVGQPTIRVSHITVGGKGGNK